MGLISYNAATGMTVPVTSTSFTRLSMFDADNRDYTTWQPEPLTQYAFNQLTGEVVEIDPEQAWFWTDEWQAKEREAEEDFREGWYEEVEDIDAFFDSL